MPLSGQILDAPTAVPVYHYCKQNICLTYILLDFIQFLLIRIHITDKYVIFD